MGTQVSDTFTYTKTKELSMRQPAGICMLMLLATHPLFAAEKQTQEPDLLKDATIKIYKTIDEDVNLKLYIFNPAGHKVTDKSPAIVFFFGGGWNSGTPTQFAPQAKYMASRGMVAICAEYRTKKPLHSNA